MGLIALFIKIDFFKDFDLQNLYPMALIIEFNFNEVVEIILIHMIYLYQVSWKLDWP